MATLPRLSEETEESDDSFDLNVDGPGPGPSSFESSRPPSSKQSAFNNYNFSRPRPTPSRLQSDQSQQSYLSQQSLPSQPPPHARPNLQHLNNTTNKPRSYASSSSSNSKGSVHAISAFHDPSQTLPDEPRFSNESDRTTIPSSENSGGSDFFWDGERGELRAKRRPQQNFDRQRYERDPRPRTERSGSHSSKSSAGSNSKSLRKQITNLSMNNAITKRVSVDQQSERVSMSTDGHEDTASHHTVSDDEGSGSFDMEGNWQSSNYDTSGLSDATIRKLLKKGVNPHLYAEMKAAKKGRNKLIGPLLGNSFIA